MKKITGRLLLMLMLILIAICGCGTMQEKNNIIEEVNKEQEETDKGETEEKREGLRIVFTVTDEAFTEEELNETIYKIQKRIENEGIEAAVVYRNAIRLIQVDVPGVTDKEILLHDLGNKGELYFVLGTGNIESGTYDESTGAYRYALLKSREELEAAGAVILTGEDVKNASSSLYNGYSGVEPVVSVDFTEAGTEKFAKATETHVGENIAIVYDGEILCAPMIQQAITDGKAMISGGFTVQEAESMAAVIRIGELPLELREISREIVAIK